MKATTITKFDRARKQYLIELEELRKKYALRFYKILKSEENNEPSRYDKESISAVLH